MSFSPAIIRIARQLVFQPAFHRYNGKPIFASNFKTSRNHLRFSRANTSPLLTWWGLRAMCTHKDGDKQGKDGDKGEQTAEQTPQQTTQGTENVKKEDENNVAQARSTKLPTETKTVSYKDKRRRIDYSKKYTDNITITAVRAMSEYLLKSSDLEQLRKTTRRSPYEQEGNSEAMMVFLRSDVEAKAIEVWGSKEALELEKKRRKQREDIYKEHVFLLKRAMKEFDSYFGEAKPPKPSFFEGAGKVVMSAIIINAANFLFKLVAWMYSGSSSMFSEAIHSAADVCNQVILALGIRQSIKGPSPDHPYGFTTIRYVSSLISGVAIFCIGAGLSCYHGIMGLIHPEPMESLLWSYCILAGALLTEGATLSIAYNAIKKGAKEKQQSFTEYVLRSRDPSINVVLLEDAAAVLGVLVAAGCMGLTSWTGNPMYDSLGSLAIGSILGFVSVFLIYSNTEALLGRSIPETELLKISSLLENDVMVRGVYDVKATDMGVGTIRFKAELDFDGKEVTRSYLDGQDLESLLKELQTYTTMEEIEGFMLKHGERIIDKLGAEVDRIEKEIKKLNPDVRHVDLEIL
ncbi:zinc transporter 9-like [Patiria miniata]|uniref:Proton-coupled zinc antiporter SLC30A9, mitochondrial n=1 Tax=Patiria miniata TaxID=46514 RepID=A0A914BTD5_PATMI|nr:zinc transporter 9-like [Patiria miniata]